MSTARALTRSTNLGGPAFSGSFPTGRITAIRCRAVAATEARHSPGVLYRSSVDTAAETRAPADALTSLDLIPFALVRKNSTALRDCNCLCSTGSIQLAEY